MHICYLANAVSIHTRRWAQYFASRDCQVTVISFQHAVIDGVRVLSLPTRTGWSRLDVLANLGRVRRLVRSIDPDILHSHYVTSYGLAGALCNRHPFLITAWGSDVLIAPERSRVYRQIVRFSLSRADLITTSAEHVTQHLVTRCYAPAEKIVTFPFGVDVKIFNPARRKRDHQEKCPVVISTRTLDTDLNVDVFIRAIPAVLGTYPDCRVLVAGDGPQRANLERLATDLGVSRNVEFCGIVSHEQMPNMLGEVDIYVSTSPSDANHVGLNEAMACGVFPVVTDISANRSWIKSGENGLLFACGDAEDLARVLTEALARPAWRQSVMAQNWEIVRTRASWDDSMAKMHELYYSLSN